MAYMRLRIYIWTGLESGMRLVGGSARSYSLGQNMLMHGSGWVCFQDGLADLGWLKEE